LKTALTEEFFHSAFSTVWDKLERTIERIQQEENSYKSFQGNTFRD